MTANRRITIADVLAPGPVDSLAVADLPAERERVIALLFDLDERASAVRDQIDEAKGDARQYGRYADADWFRRTNGAARALGRVRQAAQLRLGEVNRALRRSNADRSWADRFVDVARETLPAEVFEGLRVRVGERG